MQCGLLFFQRIHWWLFFYVILLFQKFSQQGFVLADFISVTKSTQGLYDRAPKLSIRGNGFTEDVSDISLILGTNPYNPLKMDEDYIVTKDSDNNGLILKLLPERRWADLSSAFTSPPLSLTLYKVFFPNISGDVNHLLEPVVIASVIRTPIVHENPDLTIYRSVSQYLQISGEGLKSGIGKVSLYFSPSIVKDLTYQDSSFYPLHSNEITLRLRETYSWRADPGPLRLVGIDTGAGPVKLLGSDGGGVIIAQVVENPDPSTVVVDFSATTQILYHNSWSLTIYGKNLNLTNVIPAFTRNLSFATRQIALTTNYDHIQLEFFPPLDRGTVCGWRSDVENLPAPLYLISINDIGAGPDNSRVGVPIATIFESISVDKSDQIVYRSQTSAFNITGKGFPVPSSGYHPIISFSSTVLASFQVTVFSRSLLQVNIPEGSDWLGSAGYLFLRSVNPVDGGPGPSATSFSSLTVAKVLENENYRGLLPQSDSQSVLIQFDVTVGAYLSTCLPVFGVFLIPEGFVEMIIQLEKRPTLYLTYFLLYFPGSNDYIGNWEPTDNNINRHEEYGSNKIGEWPYTFTSYESKTQCKSATFSTLRFSNNISEVCFSSVGTSKGRFRGQLQLNAIQILNPEPINTPFPFTPCRLDTTVAPTAAPTRPSKPSLRPTVSPTRAPSRTFHPSCHPTYTRTKSPNFPPSVSPTIVPSSFPTTLAPSHSPQEAKNYITSQVYDHYTLIQFDLMMGYGRPFCQPVFPLTNHSIDAYDQLIFKIQYELTSDGEPHWLSDFQVYFPDTSYYYGNCYTCSNKDNAPWSPTSTIPLANWPNNWSGNQRNLDTCYSTSTYLSPVSLSFSEICMVNTCAFCSPSSLQKFRGQLKIEARQTLALNEDKITSQRQVLPEIPCTFNPVIVPTMAPSPVRIINTIAPSMTVSRPPGVRRSPTMAPFMVVSSSPVVIRSPTTNPSQFGGISDMSFHSFSDRMFVSFDALLQLNQALCTSTFEGSVPLDPAIPILSFAYEVYSLTDNDEGFLEIYFPGNNLWFFANNHNDQCYSYEQILDVPLNFNQICIRKSCRREPCIPATSSSSSSIPVRYRGSILLTGYRSPTITSLNDKEEEEESFKPFVCTESNLQDTDNEVFWTKETIFDWLLLLILGCLVLMLIIGVIYCCCRYSKSRRYYDDDYPETTRRRKPIPVMMEMIGSPLYRNTRRNPRLANTLFAIPSNIMIPDQESHVMDIGLITVTAPPEQDMQSQYQPLTSPMIEDEVPEELAVISVGSYTKQIEDEAKV
eukprot:gene3459-3688_t